MILSQQLNSITLNVEKQHIDYLHSFFSFLDMDYDLDNSTFYLKNYSLVDFEQFKNKMNILSDKEKIQFISVMSTDLYNQLVYLQSVDRSFLQISPEYFYIFKKENNYFFLYIDFDNLYAIDKNEIYIDKPFIKTKFCDDYINQIVELDVHVPLSCYYYSLCKFILHFTNIYFKNYQDLKHKISFMQNHPIYDFFLFCCNDNVKERFLYLIH